MNTLASRDKTRNDIIANLFTGYMACKDKIFIEYMENVKTTTKKEKTLLAKESCER
jgi:hypothetical protein